MPIAQPLDDTNQTSEEDEEDEFGDQSAFDPNKEKYKLLRRNKINKVSLYDMDQAKDRKNVSIQAYFQYNC